MEAADSALPCIRGHGSPADLSYIPVGSFSATITEVPGVISSGMASGRLVAFDSGVQFHLGLLKSRSVPYAAALIGFGHASAEGDVAVQYGTQVQRMRFDESSTEFGAGGGFGVRIYGGSRWGDPAGNPRGAVLHGRERPDHLPLQRRPVRAFRQMIFPVRSAAAARCAMLEFRALPRRRGGESSRGGSDRPGGRNP